MHILLSGEFPGERQSYTITTALFTTTQTISCSITQSKLAGSCTEQSPYQLILIIILSTYKVRFNFKALFKQRGPNWGCPGVAVFDRGRIVRNTVLHSSAPLLLFLFSIQTHNNFTFVFPLRWTICSQQQTQKTTVPFSRGLQSKPEILVNLCIWTTCRLELKTHLFFFYYFCWLKIRKLPLCRQKPFLSTLMLE